VRAVPKVWIEVPAAWAGSAYRDYGTRPTHLTHG